MIFGFVLGYMAAGLGDQPRPRVHVRGRSRRVLADRLPVPPPPPAVAATTGTTIR